MRICKGGKLCRIYSVMQEGDVKVRCSGNRTTIWSPMKEEVRGL